MAGSDCSENEFTNSEEGASNSEGQQCLFVINCFLCKHMSFHLCTLVCPVLLGVAPGAPVLARTIKLWQMVFPRGGFFWLACTLAERIKRWCDKQYWSIQSHDKVQASTSYSPRPCETRAKKSTMTMEWLRKDSDQTSIVDPKSRRVPFARLNFICQFSMVRFSCRSLSSRPFRCHSLHKFSGRNRLLKIRAISALGNPGYLLATKSAAVRVTLGVTVLL